MGSIAMDRKVEVAIIGGGFGGLSLAIGLQKYPHLNTTIYEAARKFEEVGAGVILSSNAQSAMDLIDPRIRQGYESRASSSEADGVDSNGLYANRSLVVGEGPEAMQPISHVRDTRPASTIHRAHFLDELVKLVPAEAARFGKRLEGIDESDSENDTAPIVLNFADGTSAKADVVIGCDGMNSFVRKHLLGQHGLAAAATTTGVRSCRALVPIAEAKAKLGEVSDVPTLYCGKDNLLVVYTVANKSLYHLSLCCWNTDSSLQTNAGGQLDVQAVKKRFGTWDPWIQKNMELVPDEGVLSLSLSDMPPAPTYFKKRIGMLGDAAHGTSPFLGAGAGQAIEDAYVLSELLGVYLDPASKDMGEINLVHIVPMILQSYDTVRRFRSQKIVARSRQMGRIITQNEPGVGGKKSDIVTALGNIHEWILEEDQKEQLKDAQLIFESLRSCMASTTAKV